jgi:VanZ family protein
MNQPAGVRRRWLAATIAYIALIFFVSSRPYLHAPGPEFDLKDKLAHALEYGVLTFLLWRALAPALARDRLTAALALVAMVAVLASADELFQGTIPGRLTDLHDWFADLTGAAVAATACLVHASRAVRVRVAAE